MIQACIFVVLFSGLKGKTEVNFYNSKGNCASEDHFFVYFSVCFALQVWQPWSKVPQEVLWSLPCHLFWRPAFLIAQLVSASPHYLLEDVCKYSLGILMGIQPPHKVFISVLMSGPTTAPFWNFWVSMGGRKGGLWTGSLKSVIQIRITYVQFLNG